jgi:hypothetical protein
MCRESMPGGRDLTRPGGCWRAWNGPPGGYGRGAFVTPGANPAGSCRGRYQTDRQPGQETLGARLGVRGRGYRGWHESTLLSRQPRRDQECK